MKQGSNRTFTIRFFYQILLLGLVGLLSSCDLVSPFWLGWTTPAKTEYAQNKVDDFFDYSEHPSDEVTIVDPLDHTLLLSASSIPMKLAPTVTPITATHPIQTLTQAQRYHLSQRYAAQKFEFLSYYTEDDDGLTAITLNFSAPLHPEQHFLQLISVIDLVDGKLSTRFELAEDLMSLSIRALPAERNIIISLSKDLVGINARSLLHDQRIELTTPSAIHAVGFLNQGTLLPIHSSAGLAILSSNVKYIDLNFYKIDANKLAEFYLKWKNSGVLSLEQLNRDFRDELNGKKLHFSTKVELLDAMGYRKQFNLPVQQIPDLQQSGIYVVLMNETGSYYSANPATAFMMTDIGVTLHRYAKQWQIALQSLSSGAPLANTEVQLLNLEGTVLYQAFSDDAGWLTLPDLPEAVLLMARHDTQMTLLDLQQDGLDLTAFNLGGADYTKKQFVLFDPVYQPKESLTLSGLLRSDSGARLAAQSIQLAIYNPNGTLRDMLRWASDDGFYQYHYLLDEQMEFGVWRVVLDLGGTEQVYLFNLEERPHSAKINWLNQSEAVALAQQPIHYDLVVESVPQMEQIATEAKVTFSAESALVFSQYPAFLFGNNSKQSYHADFSSSSYTSNAYGEFDIEFTAQRYPELFKLPMLLSADIKVGQQGQLATLHRSISRLIWPDKTIYGVRPLHNLADYPGGIAFQPHANIEFEIVAIDAMQQRVALPSLVAKLIREKQHEFWKWDPNLGWIKQLQREDIYLSSVTTSKLDDLLGYFSFPIERGAYRIELYQEARLVNRLSFNVGEDIQKAADSSPQWPIEPLPVTLKRTEQGLELNIISQQAANGAILIESSQQALYKQWIQVVPGENSYILPLDSSWSHSDSYVSVWLLTNLDHSAAIKRYLAIQPLPPALQYRPIQATVDFQEELALGKVVNLYMNLHTFPESPTQINALFSFIAKHPENAPSLNFYAQHNWLYEMLFAPRGYPVKLSDVYNKIISVSSAQPLNEQPRLQGANTPKITPLYPVVGQVLLQKVSVNEMGIAKFKLTLPKQQGEFYLVGQIWSENQYGTVLQAVNLLDPYRIELTAPERLFLGDKTEIELKLSSQIEKTQQLNVKLSSLQQPAHFEPFQVAVDLAAQQQQQLRFPLPTLLQLGQVEMQLEITDNTPNARSPYYSQKLKLEVVSAYPKQHDSYAFNLPVAEAWQLAEPALQELEPETVQFDVLLTDDIPLTMLHYLSDLADVDNKEMLIDKISVIWSWLGLDNGVRLGVASALYEERQQRIQKVIDQLNLLQLPNGGFPISTLDSRESPWSTVYLADFLRVAQQQQYQVDPKLSEALLQRVKSYTTTELVLPDVASAYQSQANAAVKSYAALLLAQHGSITQQELLAINKVVSHTLSGLPMLQLGIALEMLGERAQSSMLIALGTNQYRNNDFINIGDYGSNLRDRALSLRLLTQHQLNPSLLHNLRLTLSRQVMLQQRLSESEKTALFFVARDLIDLPQSEWRVELNDNALISDRVWQYRFSGRQAVKRGLSLINRGSTALQSRVYLSGYPKTQPNPVSNTLTIERQLYNLNGELIDPLDLQVGDKVAVFLVVTSQGKLSDLLLEDSLTAGLSIDPQSIVLKKRVAQFSQAKPEIQQLFQQISQTQITRLPAHPTGYRALLSLDQDQTGAVFFMATATQRGEYAVAMPTIYSMSKPQHYAVGKAPNRLIVKDR